MHAFILAGGFATRLWPLTERRAKPLLPLAGKPILTHLVSRIPEGIPVTVSTNAAFKHSFEDWRDTLGRKSVGILIEDTKSDDQKLGALGATAQWIQQEQINEDILLLTGDNYIGFSVQQFLEMAQHGVPLIAAQDIGSKEEAKKFGTVIVDEDGRTVMGFEEKPQEPKSSIISTGCSFIPKEHIQILVEYAKEHPDNVGGIFEEFLRKGIRTECFTFSEPWFDIGSFEAYLAATRMLVGDECQLHETATFTRSVYEESVVVGARSHIENSTLRNVVVFDDCRIENCILEDCIVDNHCHLRGVDLSKKMLREGTELTQRNTDF